MYHRHPVFIEPQNKDIKIWRYMDFTKFVNLLESSSLFFTRSDKFEDPFEGTFSKANQSLRTIVYKDSKIPEPAFLEMDHFYSQLRKNTFINCWHMNNYESAAMWKLYLKSDEGIAIQSTFQKFCRSFDSTSEEVFIGKVHYVDFENDWIPEGNTFFPYLHKRKSFEHENEIRAIIQDLSNVNTRDISKPRYEYGHDIEININTLIENVYVAPNSQEWFSRLVESILKKYELNKKVIKSSLYDTV